MRAARAGMAALAAAALVAAGCTEDAITNLPPDQVPGRAAETVEITLRAGQLPDWHDTTVAGFITPGSAGLLILASQPELQAHILGRFSTLPDTVQLDTVRHAVLAFEEATLRLNLDTLRSIFPAAGALRVELRTLARGFEPREATWTEAAEGDPWVEPGGDFGTLLASAELTGVTDTVRAPVAGVPVDSLLTAWRDAEGEPGVGLLVAEGDGRLAPTGVTLEMRVRLEGVDTLVAQARSALPTTFLFDPPPPPAGVELRVGGIPSHRAYVSFVPPERVGSVPLRGSIINRAELVFHPLDPLEPPFALGRSGGAVAVGLLGDFAVLGARTPIGGALGLSEVMNPDSLAAGRPLVFPVDSLLRAWAAAEPESLRELRVGIRSSPEGGDLGAWEFGSVEAEEGRQPLLRLLLTPRTAFNVP